MNNWSNADILRFLECYQAETCIWDPRDKDHKDKKKVGDAWSRLSEVFHKPVKEIKNKKEILMVTFRKHLKKKQDSIRSGSGVDDIYEPSWFAYQAMESFLLPLYTAKIGLNSETQSRSSETPVEVTVDEAEETDNESNMAGSSSSAPAVSITSNKKCRPAARDAAEQQMATAFSQLTNVLCQRQSETSKGSKEEDECDLYAKLLAKKLRELRKDEMKLMMYEIDGLFIKRIKLRSYLRETPSPQYSVQYSIPSSASSGYIVIPKQPHAQASFFDTSSTSNHDSLSTFDISSTPLRPPPLQNNDDNSEFNTSNPPSITIVSDEIIVPRKRDVSEVFRKAYEDFEDYE